MTYYDYNEKTNPFLSIERLITISITGCNPVTSKSLDMLSSRQCKNLIVKILQISLSISKLSKDYLRWHQICISKLILKRLRKQKLIWCNWFCLRAQVHVHSWNHQSCITWGACTLKGQYCHDQSRRSTGHGIGVLVYWRLLAHLCSSTGNMTLSCGIFWHYQFISCGLPVHGAVVWPEKEKREQITWCLLSDLSSS